MIICIFFFFLALAIYCRSPSAYESLKDFNSLRLPSISSLKKYVSAYTNEPGLVESHLQEARDSYDKMVESKIDKGENMPNYEGILIFDEVKVCLGVAWSSVSGKCKGLALSPEEVPSLYDVYRTLDPQCRTQQASYILQFLWRCNASRTEIVGPYFTTTKSLSTKFIYPCLMETIRLFLLYGFRTKLLVCDGASSNLSLLKMLCCGKSGAFDNILDGGEDKVPHSFTSPFNNETIFCTICPSHQVCY